MDLESGPDADTPRPIGVGLLLCMLEHGGEAVATVLLGLAARLQQQQMTPDVVLMREACYRCAVCRAVLRAVPCHAVLVGAAPGNGTGLAGEAAVWFYARNGPWGIGVVLGGAGTRLGRNEWGGKGTAVPWTRRLDPRRVVR